MWDLAPMSIFINYSLCELFISSQYGTGVLHLKSSTCNREEEGDLAAGYVGLQGVASSLQREREWFGCWTCRVLGAVAKVFDRKTQRSYRKKKKTTLVNFEGSDTKLEKLKRRQNTEKEMRRREEQR
jgi:hypothetical protein